MTIAAGFICNEGVVIAADSQETIPGYTKDLTKGKVITVTIPTSERHDGILTYVYAGSGWTDYIETAMEKVSESVSPCKNLLEAAEAIDERLRTFHEKRIVPWAAFPQDQQPSVELLIGLSVSTAFGLFHYTGTSFHRCGEHKAIGTGAILANSLMSTYYSHGDSIEGLVGLASYIIHKVKKHGEGCGGFTQVVALRANGDFALVEGVERFEAEIGELEKKSVEQFRTQLFATPSFPKITWLWDELSKGQEDGSP